MTAFLSDTMTEGSTINLTAHSPETGGAWSKHVNFSADLNVVGGAGYAIGATASTALYINAATPPGADYYVEALIDRDPSGSDVHAGVLGRASNSASTLYQAYYNASSGAWILDKLVAGTNTQLGSYSASLTSGTAVNLRLEMIGTAIKVYVGGIERISVTDSAVTAAGFAGLRGRQDGRVLNVVAEPTDTTAPTLSSPTGAATGSTTANLSVSTNEDNGTLYAVVTTSATGPTGAQVRAGQDHTGAAAAFADDQAVSGTGAQPFSATGLTASTTYYAHFEHRDAAGNDSSVSTSASFTTDAPPSPPTAPTIGTTTSITSTGATINWTDNSSNEVSFQVQVETPSGAANWTDANASPAAADATSLAISGLSSGTEYRPRVRASNTGGDSAWSTGTAFTTDAGGGGSTLLPKLMQLLN